MRISDWSSDVCSSDLPPIAAEAAAANFEQDRADILAMAGNYRVSFNMQESTRWDPDYEVLEPKRSGGNEVVRVIEDTGRKIILQHMLVITGDADKSRSEEHTSELQSLMRISYAVFCLKKKKTSHTIKLTD